ncbi:MAG: MFS transporter [Lachnospiraceae bacterium]|nr:MFS transporter [Lachnospiraceae bacterium]
MKLKTGQTIRVGFAFLSICAFWQMYNSIIPLILTNTFAMNETISGAIMAADNVLAIFLLPLFGGISDRCKSKMGRRKPFLLYGTLVSVVLMLLLPILDNRYAAAPSAGTKVLFIVVLGCILVSMGTYRSPAVALMPDVTPKPLRSKANAIINLMGAIGGILYLAIATVMYSEKRTAGLDHVNYLPLFMIVAGIMIVGMLIVLITVDEVGLNRQMAEYEAAHPEEQDTIVDASGEEKLPPEVKRSLGLLLASIALWFISYNAMETWFTTYANRMWDMSLGSASLCLTIATLGAILSYIPVGAIASNIGRKKTILSGVVLMTACFVICFVYTLTSDHFSPILYVIFAFVGMGWAAINVNSLPMVVEMCKGSDIGRFTGYYYTFSMAAQIVTPIVAGTLMNRVGYTTLFPYAAVFMAAAFVTMIQVKHGDSKLITKKGLEAFDFDD